MIIISVVRNSIMYNRLVKNNPYNQGASFYPIDNNVENKSIAVRYNQFLDNYDYTKPDWFVFCHEDWKVKENWLPRFDKLNKNKLYGPIGIYVFSLAGKIIKNIYGRITHSDKDGSNPEKIGVKVKIGTKVNVFDCQCLIVHSSLVKNYNLRFDENLDFDLYVEDFCINAQEKYHIPSCIMPLKCHHYSKGKVSGRFLKKLQYLQEKYKNAKGMYSTPVYTGQNDVIGQPRINIKAVIFYCLQRQKRFLYQNKITKSNKRLIKICKIPVYSKKITGEKK